MIGAFEVVVSLVYVGLEINENTVEVREANRQGLVNRSFEATGRNEPAIAVYRRGRDLGVLQKVFIDWADGALEM